MKKTLICLIMLSFMIPLCLCACQRTQTLKMPDLSGDISLSGKLCEGGMQADVKLERSGGVWTVKFLSPESLNGLVLKNENGTVSVCYDGISFTYEDGSVPFKNAALSITDSIDAAADPQKVSVKQSAAGLEISGAISGSGFIVTFTDGHIGKVSAGGWQLTVYS